MNNINVFKIITLVLEGILAIPILGGLVVLVTLWVALLVAFVFHLVILILNNQNKKKIKTNGNIIGLIASVLGWIPFLGWGLHFVSAIVLAIEVFSSKN